MQLKYRVRDWLSSEGVQLSIGILFFAIVSLIIFGFALGFNQPIYPTLVVSIALLAIRPLRDIAKGVGSLFHLIFAIQVGFDDELGF